MSGDKKPEFNFNPSNFKFDFSVPAKDDGSSDEEEHGHSHPHPHSHGKGQGPKGIQGLTPEMMAAIQAQLGGLVGKNSGLYATLPEQVKRRIKALEGLQDRYEDLETLLEKEIYELERKYEALYKPLFARRSEIITGKSEPTEEEVEAGGLSEDEDEDDGPKIEEVKETPKEETPAAKKEEENITGVPNFWLGALQNNEIFNISEDDEHVLKHLVDITYETFDERFSKPVNEDDPEDFEDRFSGFKVTFQFAPNEHFTNEFLSKTFFLIEDEEDELVFDHSDGTKIEWKAGKNITVKTVQKQVGGGGRGGKRGRGRGGRGGGGGGGQTKTITVEEPTDSFFNFFCSQNSDTLQEATEEEQDQAEMYYAMGETLRHKIIPSAVLWYLGIAQGPSDEDIAQMMGGGGDGDESYDSQEDGDFDPKDAKAPECKQQ